MMIEVIDQYGERHRFDDNHCIHDADSATGMVQIGVSNDSGDYDVVATFLRPARIGEVSDDTCFTLREVPAGIARQIEELRAENEKLKADAKYGWQAQELILKNQALKTDLAKEREELACTIDILEQTRAELAAEREKVKALEATWIGYNKLQEQLAAAQAVIEQMREALERCTKFTQEDYDALALQPCPEVLNKVRADAVRRCAERMPHFDGEGSVQQLMWLCEEAQRIEQGGA